MQIYLLLMNKTIVNLNLAGNGIAYKALVKIRKRQFPIKLSNLLYELTVVLTIDNFEQSTVLNTIQRTGIVTSLNISHNFCGALSSKRLVHLISTSEMSHLDISWMGLRLPFVKELHSLLNVNKHLQVLNLSYNGLCDDCANIFAEIWVDAVDDSASKMALKHLNLGHNRIQKRGAISLALAAEKVAEISQRKSTAQPFLLEKVILNGNPIGEVGIRACMHAMSCMDMEWEIFECLPDSACADFFERGVVEKSYELDLEDFHDRLVADRLFQIAGTRFKDKRIIQLAVHDEKEIALPDDQDHLFPLENVFQWDEGILKLVLEGPWNSFTCRFLGEVAGEGTYFDIVPTGDLPIHDVEREVEEAGEEGEKDKEEHADKSDLPDTKRVLGERVYFEFSDKAESELSKVTTYVRKQKVQSSFVCTYQWGHDPADAEDEGESGDRGGDGRAALEEGLTGKLYVVRLPRVPEGFIKGVTLRIGGKTGRVHRIDDSVDAADTDAGGRKGGGGGGAVDVHIIDLSEDGSLLSKDLAPKHAISLTYSVLMISSLFDEEQKAALEASPETCMCWYMDPVARSPMENAALGKILKMLQQVFKRCGEYRMFQFVMGIAKDSLLTAEQAGSIVHLFTTQKYQTKVHRSLCGADADLRIPKKAKRKRLAKGDELIEHFQDADLSALQRALVLNDQAAHEAAGKAFFDLFGGVLSLKRLSQDVSDDLNYETQTDKQGVAFRLNDKDSALPAYDFQSIRFQFLKEPEDKIVKVDFKIVVVKHEERVMLIQDQAIAANDGGSGQYSLMKLTEEGDTYKFEFPSRSEALLKPLPEPEEEGEEEALEREDGAENGDVGKEGEEGKGGEGEESAKMKEDGVGSMWSSLLDNIEVSLQVVTMEVGAATPGEAAEDSGEGGGGGGEGDSVDVLAFAKAAAHRRHDQL